MNRKPLFDTIRRLLGRGFDQSEVDSLDRAIDASLDLPQDRVPSVPSCGTRADGAQHAPVDGEGKDDEDEDGDEYGPVEEREADDPFAAARAEAWEQNLPCECPGKRGGTDRGLAHYRRGSSGPEPVLNIAGEGPCCDSPTWPDCRDCPHYPPVNHLLNTMEEARPEGAPEPRQLGWDPIVAEERQAQAFAAGDADWWRRGPDGAVWEADAGGIWHPAAKASEEGESAGGGDS